MTDAGQRPHLVTVQRATVTLDSYGGEEKTWGNHATGWARARFGTGQERREAAQENASQAATFEFDWNPKIAAVRVTDRLYVFESYWDITGNVTIGGNRECHITAVTAVEDNAALDVEISLSGSTTGTAIASATIRQVAPLAGAVTSNATLTGDLTVSSAGEELAMMDGSELTLMDGVTELALMG